MYIKFDIIRRFTIESVENMYFYKKTTNKIKDPVDYKQFSMNFFYRFLGLLA